jgi:hypothetical protein
MLGGIRTSVIILSDVAPRTMKDYKKIVENGTKFLKREENISNQWLDRTLGRQWERGGRKGGRERLG